MPAWGWIRCHFKFFASLDERVSIKKAANDFLGFLHACVLFFGNFMSFAVF
ncbi:hypothetical protein GQS_06435 [Thermococcus sp. 4557]|nr:hypothetical protein GQS_06435 [Thermococcus sp. 4557]